MTLRKKETDVQPEFDPVETIKMEKFKEEIQSLAFYLGVFYVPPIGHGSYRKVGSVSSYNDRLFAKRPPDDCYHSDNLESGPFFLCVAGNNGQTKNPFVKVLIENIFPRGRYMRIVLPYGTTINENKWKDYFYLSDHEYYCVKELTENRFNIWRDDIVFPSHFTGESFLRTLEYVNRWNDYENWKPYNLFWNLFLCAIDDDIYNEQLPNVVELAHYLDFDEPMMRDWCRAVEYVLAGNKLSEDCDLECETVEGARFFLHKKE